MGRYSAYQITGVLASVLWAQNAVAADLLYDPVLIEDQDLDLTLPAVSDINGKVEFYGGFVNPGGGGFRAAGSLSIPVHDRFGVQLDASLIGTGAGFIGGGAIHAFTRDPENYLLGITGAAARGPAGTIGVIGVEGELYLDRISLEAWAGVGGIDYDVLPDVAGVFIFADAAYYVTDDFRLNAGFTHLIGENSLHLGAEYLLRDFAWPISLAGDARVAASGAYSLMVGIKGYFGADPGKSLIDRHRQDDPTNRALLLSVAAGSLLFATPPEEQDDDPSPEDFDNENDCLEAGFAWDPEFNFCFDPESSD